MSWYLKVLQNYFTFSGRARRKEYWFFILFHMIFLFVLAILDASLGTMAAGGAGVLSAIYGLAILIPSIAVSVRRLHDIGFAGWWYLIISIPIVGAIVLLVFHVLDSEPGDNRFGPNPKLVPAEAGA